MNSFGLGLVLNFVDNASSGMGSASRTFQQMSATADAMSSAVSTSITDMVTASYALDQVGSTMMNAGSSILNLYGAVSQSVIDAGQQMLNYRMQLSALYGSVDAGEAKIEEIKDYAMKSVFDIQSLIPAVTMMKAVGIEAMSEITTSSGEHTQKLLDYASDIAAMVPNMRNTYGTGVKAAMGALKEYIAEGNALSLKRGAGLDITGILGEDKGSTIEERSRQIADLVEKLNIVGYTANLAGTPTQRLSNMQDALFNSLTKVADSGVFEVYCSLLERLSNWVFSLVENEETFNVITGVVADTVTALLTPLSKLLDFLIENGDAIINWIKENPKLTKNILLTVAAIGGLLVAGGALLKLVSSIGMASAGLSFLKSFPTLLGAVGKAFTGLITKALPFVALAGAAYFAWKNNLFGIRDAVKDLGTIFSLIGDAWSDNTLSKEDYDLANSLGILPLIESLLQLKYYWDYFVEGFKTGFKSFFEGLAESLSWLEVFGIDVNAIAAGIGDFLKSLVQVGAEDNWEKVGKIVGELTAGIITLAVIINVCKPIISILSAIGKIALFIGKSFKWVGGILKTVFSPLLAVFKVLRGGQGVGVFTKLIEVFKAVIAGGMKLKDAMMIVFGPIGTVVAGVVSFVGGLVMAVVGFFKQLKNGFSWFWEIIKWIGLALAAVGAVILGVVSGPIAAIIAAVVGVVTTIIVLVKQYWNEICAFFSAMGSWIYNNIIVPVANFFVNLWNGIVNGVVSFVEGVKSVFITVVSWIKTNIIDPIAGFFSGLWDGIVVIFSTIGDAISGVIKGAINGVIGGAVAIINGFIKAINFAISAINLIPGVNITKLSYLEAPQLAEGGVVDKPTTAIIGEAGEEAVVPLKNNTEWIDKVAQKVAPKIVTEQRQLSPVSAEPSQEVHNDYSVTFSAGSVVIQLSNASDAELEKAAEKLMKIIERKQQLKKMAVRKA